MKLVMQPTFSTCGQACIAMITGKDIKEVIKDMRTDGPTSIGQLIEALDFYGIKHAEKNVRISKKNPVQSDFSILTLHMNAGYTHWVLYYYGKYYDPEFGLLDKCHPEGRITSYFAIYE
jgi:hypothetical protein